MAQIPLRNRHGEIVAHALVDDEDFARFGHLRWHLQGKVGYQYVVNTRGTRREHQHVLLHREIMAPIPNGLVVDHVNRDQLDNRRSNLRLATHRQNMANSKPRGSLPKGVSRRRRRLGFFARIRFNYRTFHLGSFATPEEAGDAYATAARILNGDFARST